MRELHIPLHHPDSRPRDGAGELSSWARCVQQAHQPCLLVAIDGNLVAISDSARSLLGPLARPGLPETSWWREKFLYAPTPSNERSLIARAAASGTAAHSVVQLVLDDVPVTVQVLVAPLETAGIVAEALLVFLRPVTVVAPA